jgi:hypothetical protein
LDLQHRFAARNNFIKTSAQILGGAFFLFGLYFTWANLVATQEKNVTDLYTKAIEQLGNEKSLEVRLGGIYALERIARDSKKDHWTIMEVLTAYVRERAPATSASKGAPTKEAPPVARKKVPAKPGNQTSEEKPKPKADIQAVLTVLGRTAIPFAPKAEERRLDFGGTNLAGAELYEANLQGANLEKANLQGAVLTRANLTGANLGGANLQGAGLDRANLQGASLREANIRGANLWEGNLQGAILGNANLQGAILWEANLREAALVDAKLQGADLRGPKTADGFTLGAKGLTSWQVAGAAYWDETTKWPEGFSPPAPRRLPPKEEKQERR